MTPLELMRVLVIPFPLMLTFYALRKTVFIMTVPSFDEDGRSLNGIRVIVGSEEFLFERDELVS